jgi:hypothetical protein
MSISCSVCDLCGHQMQHWLRQCAKCKGRNYHVVHAENHFELERKLSESRPKQNEPASEFLSALLVSAIISLLCLCTWLGFRFHAITDQTRCPTELSRSGYPQVPLAVSSKPLDRE